MVFLIKSAVSQQYYPFPTGSATWSENCSAFEVYPNPHHEHRTIRYFLDGDTTIDSKVYSKVFGYNGATEIVDTLNSHLLGGLREDSLKHIYYLPLLIYPGCMCYHCSMYIFPPEYLLYRFDIEIGETVSLGPGSKSLDDFIVYAIDSVLVDGSYRKRYDMNPVYGYGDQYWIEGIGSDMGLFGPSCNPFEGFLQLLCYEDSATFYNPGGTCFIWTFVSVPENESETGFIVSPNPAKGKLVISVQGFNGQAGILKAFNLFGQEIYNKTISSNISKHEIDISNWQPGIYVFSLYEEGELLQTDKVVVVR